MPASAHFVLSFTKAMTDQLSELLAGLEPAPLSIASLDQLERPPGVYELLQEGTDGVRRVMYVGKADRSVPDRLGEHLRKIQSRHNIDIRDMFFVCAYVERDLHAVAPEGMLIDHRRRAGDAPWNGGVGFGPHDPVVSATPRTRLHGTSNTRYGSTTLWAFRPASTTSPSTSMP